MAGRSLALVATVLVLAVSGCGGDDDDDDAVSSPPADTATQTTGEAPGADVPEKLQAINDKLAEVQKLADSDDICPKVDEIRAKLEEADEMVSALSGDPRKTAQGAVGGAQEAFEDLEDGC